MTNVLIAIPATRAALGTIDIFCTCTVDLTVFAYRAQAVCCMHRQPPERNSSATLALHGKTALRHCCAYRRKGSCQFNHGLHFVNADRVVRSANPRILAAVYAPDIPRRPHDYLPNLPVDAGPRGSTRIAPGQPRELSCIALRAAICCARCRSGKSGRSRSSGCDSSALVAS